MTFAAANTELERRAKAIFDEVIDLPPPSRDSALQQACDGDDSVRRRVESLLVAHHHGENFLEPPPPLFGFDVNAARDSAGESQTDACDDALIGQRIARYRVLRRLGAGGMGVVYLAEQDQPRRTVALKIMRVGVASGAMLRRFEHEAEVLGHLKHPGIAQVFEAGTFDHGHGVQPYFAMEFIDGPTLTAFAAARGLDVRARLELIARVCDAVHHAHQKGVVHRDLKPDNVLVQDDDGSDSSRHHDIARTTRLEACPKVLDFGVARLTNSDFAVTTLQTDLGQIVGTLPYMSPEQVAADPAQVDVRSDVYALGVITFELLTGRVPLDVRHKSMAEAARIIVDHEPPSLTTFDREFRGDISTIVSKALEKDKARRYQSASELGEDLRRFLRHEPISARRATTAYQLRKFARRNKALVSGIAAVFFVLVLGVIGTSIGLVRARESARLAHQQEQAAEHSANEARSQRAAAEQVSRFLQQMLASVSPSAALGRDTTMVREILDNAAARVHQELTDQSDIAATLHGVIGRTYASIAEYALAIQHLQVALDLQRTISGPNARETARAESDLGRTLISADQFAVAKPLLEHALEVTRTLDGDAAPTTARAMNDLANSRRASGDYESAERLLREANAIFANTVDPSDPSRLRAINDLANVLLTRRKFGEALPLFNDVLETRLRTSSPSSPDLALAEANMARTLQFMNRLSESQDHIHRAIAIYRKVLPPGHNTLASALLSLSNLHFKRQEYDQAETLLAEALESCIQTYGEDSPSVANILAAQCDLAEARRNRGEAERLCLAAMAMRRRTLPPDHPDIAASLRQLAGIRATQSRNDDTLRLLHQALEIQRVNGASDYEACETILNLATYEFMAGRMDDAASLARQALTLMTRLLGEDHPSVLTTKGRLAKFLEAAGDLEGALPIRLDVLTRMRSLPNYEPLQVAAAMLSAGVTLTRLGRYAEAEPYLRESLELRVRDLGAEHFATAASMLHLGTCLALQSNFDEAEPMLLQAEVIWTEHSASAPQTREARQALVDLYRAWDRPEHLAHWEAKSARRPNAGGPASQPAAKPRS